VEAELGGLGIPYRLVETDALAGLLRADALDTVVLATECVAANGDLAADPGAAPLALLAARHRVAVHVCGTRSTFDPGLPDGAAIATGAATPGDRPLVDIVDADLVTSLTTDAGRWSPPGAGVPIGAR
jgi:methylthioribose-1-phosphate isomerase